MQGSCLLDYYSESQSVRLQVKLEIELLTLSILSILRGRVITIDWLLNNYQLHQISKSPFEAFGSQQMLAIQVRKHKEYPVKFIWTHLHLIQRQLKHRLIVRAILQANVQA